MPVVAIVNQKGGVGKTTLPTNLASALADTGRVLLLDPKPDPQPGVRRRGASWVGNFTHFRSTVQMGARSDTAASNRSRVLRRYAAARSPS